MVILLYHIKMFNYFSHKVYKFYFVNWFKTDQHRIFFICCKILYHFARMLHLFHFKYKLMQFFDLTLLEGMS